jgi:hypothetical protein
MGGYLEEGWSQTCVTAVTIRAVAHLKTALRMR